MSFIYKKCDALLTSLAPNPRRANRDIIIPEGIGIATIALPAKVHTGDLRDGRSPLPLCCVGVSDTRLDCQAGDSSIVEPGFNRAVSAEMVLEAGPCVRRKSSGRGNALRRKIGQRGVISFAVVHDDFGLATDAEVLVGALGGVRHGDEGDVRVGQGF